MESSSKGGEEEEEVRYNSNNVKKVKLQSTLAALLDDPILADVPKKPALTDVNIVISLEMGSAMRISILKLDGNSFDLALVNSATVKDLKLAIKNKVNEMEQSKMGHRHISWKHVWANYALSCHNQKLLDDSSALQDLGVRNGSQILPFSRGKIETLLAVHALRIIAVEFDGPMQVQFVPYVTSKGSRMHSKRRKHRFFHGFNNRAYGPNP